MITSTANAQIRHVMQLKKQKKIRTRERLFLAEGKKMVEEAPADWMERLYVSESYADEEKNQPFLSQRDYEVLKDSVFEAISDTKTPQGILAVLKMPEWDYEDVTEEPGGCYLLLEDIQDPGNLGTMLRTGEGAGVRAVIASAGTAELYNPKTVRATMGSIYRVPYFVAEDFRQTVSEMKESGILICAACLQGSVPYDAVSYRDGCGFLIGNEANGLTDETIALAGQRIRIPMEGKVESLNAAIAATILMYEANRQRRG